MARRYSYDERVTVRGYHFGIRYEPDPDPRPWDDDGHGPVSDWRPLESKRPGERVIVQDGRSARFYDVAAAQALALREGWNAPPYEVPGETARQRAARAVDRDFQLMRGWCRDDWQYTGVIVTWIDSDGAPRAPDTSESLWGVDNVDPAYPSEVASELIAECIARIEVETPDAVLSEN
jgi:hypothetical protein